MENRLKTRLENGVAVFDGAMGTELYKKNFFVNTSYESLCLNNGDAVRSIHVAYRDAGAEIITTNTYGANFNKLNKFGFGDKVAEINRAGVALARKAAGPDLLVAGDIGPVGELPQGIEYNLKQKSAILQEQLAVLAAESCDFILFESYSTKDDILVMLDAVQSLELEKPYMLSCKFDEKALLSDGTSAVEVFDLLKTAQIQPTAFGINCGVGPEPMLFVVEKIVSLSPYPVIAQPNAGSPKTVDGRMIAMCSPEYFATYAMRYVALGVKGVGGCCGTTPEDIANLARWVHPMAKTLKQKDIFTEKTEAAPQEEFPVAQRSTFAEKLMAGKWVTNVEIVPPQGYLLEQTIEKAKICRDAGFDAINMDLIAGLPKDSYDGFCRSLDAVAALNPANITIHTLALKKGADLFENPRDLPDFATVSRMVDYANTLLPTLGYKPYYLYRQKYMSGSFENVGWSRDGQDCLYNIYMMEEIHTIMSLGGGGMNKVTFPDGSIQRFHNPKFPEQYIEQIDSVLSQKEELFQLL